MPQMTFNSKDVDIIANALKFFSENAFTTIDPRREEELLQLRYDVWEMRDRIKSAWLKSRHESAEVL